MKQARLLLILSVILCVFSTLLLPVGCFAAAPQRPETAGHRQRLRDLGVRFGSLPTGPNNAITDVGGVLVGQTTLNSGTGALQPGKGPVRTGVTAIIPHPGDLWNDRVTANCFVLNGNGAMTGLDWVKESGFLEGPILLTNTLSVGTVYDATVTWMLRRYAQIGNEDTCLPVVGECDDSTLNDIRGRHVKEEHVLAALDSARGGAVEEGSVGAGTGMIGFEFKGGIGSSSRIVMEGKTSFTVGVLVNCNCGDRRELLIDGVPVGKFLRDYHPSAHAEGSIVIVVATDAPLNSLELERLAKRAALGLARTGAIAHNGSGDIIIAFSTTRRVPRDHKATTIALPEVNIEHIDPLFQAAVEATEESVINSMCMADTMVGRDGNTAPALPTEKCLDILRQHGIKIEH